MEEVKTEEPSKKVTKQFLNEQIVTAEFNIQRNDAVKKFCQWMLENKFYEEEEK